MSRLGKIFIVGVAVYFAWPGLNWRRRKRKTRNMNRATFWTALAAIGSCGAALGALWTADITHDALDTQQRSQRPLVVIQPEGHSPLHNHIVNLRFLMDNNGGRSAYGLSGRVVVTKQTLLEPTQMDTSFVDGHPLPPGPIWERTFHSRIQYESAPWYIAFSIQYQDRFQNEPLFELFVWKLEEPDAEFSIASKQEKEQVQAYMEQQ